MAAETKGGSTVVILTDGLANIGIGRFKNKEEDITEEELQKSKDFYKEVGNFAKQNQVKINLIAIISSEETNIKDLQVMCDLSGGLIERVSPQEIPEKLK